MAGRAESWTWLAEMNGVTCSNDQVTSTILVFPAPTMVEAADGAAEHITRTSRISPLLLPSSLNRNDDLVASLRRSLRKRSTSSSVTVPDHPLRLVTGTISGRRTRWREATLVLPDKADRDVLLPSRLLEGDPLLYVTHVNAVAGTGPFQLDLLSRYLHPRARMRQVIDPDRAGLAAEVNVALRPAWSIIGADLSPGLVAVTRDLIAGELFALSIAERFFDRRAEFASPWEDRVVQRATELELGARTPNEIRIVVMAGGATPPEGVHAIVEDVRLRIGTMPQGAG